MLPDDVVADDGNRDSDDEEAGDVLLHGTNNSDSANCASTIVVVAIVEFAICFDIF